jgi:hypothetical protein
MTLKSLLWTPFLLCSFAFIGCEPTDYNEEIPTYENDADKTPEDADVRIDVGEGGVDVQVDDRVDVESDRNGVDVDVDPRNDAETPSPRP